MKIVNNITFPTPKNLKCNMMPFIQGEAESLPIEYRQYSDIIAANFIEKGKIGYLTIHESFVNNGESQRGYNSKGIDRNIHIEVGTNGQRHKWGSTGGGGNTWGKSRQVLLDEDTEILIANNISNTCRVWDVVERRNTDDGDLSEYIADYPENTGYLMQSGEMARISIFTPHECIAQTTAGFRQFFRIVGDGVHGREPYWTPNPLVG